MINLNKNVKKVPLKKFIENGLNTKICGVENNLLEILNQYRKK